MKTSPSTRSHDGKPLPEAKARALIAILDKQTIGPFVTPTRYRLVAGNAGETGIYGYVFDCMNSVVGAAMVSKAKGEVEASIFASFGGCVISTVMFFALFFYRLFSHSVG